ncbi:hypothetical protein DFH08DRAFT_891503 [Mycena albidolilacea]|uniref:F-box domain-containing protein n=1 Tax=Mycena albidolilacea TaxID=1033008 RepID=A0AAD7EGE1_9AGAR|nr:hypothetical protein DFH08DRAFT_891503 [Mycena albidolilacea]
MAEPTTLLSLPNEVLIIIFENPKFPVDYLAILAVLCRRLHFIALPIYFSRNGMPSPTESAVIHLAKDGQDILAALNMALFVTSMEDITCILPHPSCTSVLPLLPHLARFRKFITRFPSVGRVTLQLDARNSMCNATGDDKALRAWSFALGSLLNCLVQRQCTELTVKYGGYLTRSYMLSVEPKKRVRRIVKAIQRLFRPRAPMEGKGWEFRRSREQGRERALTSVPSKISRSSTLTSLHIQSAVLIMPPCLNWTLSALRHCPIAFLSLFQISLEKEIWSAALSLIARAAPEITDLSLSELDSISDVEILSFCSRLPRLVTLTIGYNEEAQGTPTKYAKGRIPELRNLTSLTAPADFIRYLMRPRACLPKLMSLRISFHGKTHIRTIGEQLSDVCQLMTARTLSPSLSLSLPLYSDIAFDFDSVIKLPDETKKYFACVASLALDIFPSNPGEIARWVHLFPSVQHVSITLQSKPADANAYDDRLVQALSKDRGYIRTIVVNSQKHVLADLLPSTRKI